MAGEGDNATLPLGFSQYGTSICCKLKSDAKANREDDQITEGYHGPSAANSIVSHTIRGSFSVIRVICGDLARDPSVIRPVLRVIRRFVVFKKNTIYIPFFNI